MLKLKTAETGSLKIKKELPLYGAYISVTACAGGHVNPEYMAELERISEAARINTAVIDAISDPREKTRAQIDMEKEFGRDIILCVYDTCVKSWETALQKDDGAALDATRENFLALCEVKEKSIIDAMSSIIDEIKNAAISVEAETSKTEKN